MLTKDKIGVALVKYGESKIGINEAIESILAAMPEPLAVLADRKGYCISVIRNRKHAIHNPYNWRIVAITKGNTEKVDVEDATYAQAEQAAREYLEALPDLKK